MDSSRLPPLPVDTARAAEAVMGVENVYLRIGRQIDPFIMDSIALVSGSDQPFEHTNNAVLALATILQYAEKMTDRQMEYASCSRLDIKYALHLPLHFPGISQRRLCEFRQTMYRNTSWHAPFQNLIRRMHEASLLGGEGEEVEPTQQVLKGICSVSRLEQLLETIQLAIEVIAAKTPDQMRAMMPPHWYRHYTGFKDSRDLPRNASKQVDLAAALEVDIQHLLTHSTGLPEITGLPEVQNLRAEWVRQFEQPPERQPLWRERCCEAPRSNSISQWDGRR